MACCAARARALQVPFSLSCNTPGRLRWVTTNIARFDPSVDWPADLACAFRWNTALKAYDGARTHVCARGSRAPLLLFVQSSGLQQHNFGNTPQHLDSQVLRCSWASCLHPCACRRSR
jgi:hypothetical protein